MRRNLDMTALRSFVAVADTGGVTRAAGYLNLTQSAVSMQLKRLEESLGQTLLDRSARRIGLTPAGVQLLSYGRRLVALNDEVMSRMTDDAYEGEVALGVPHDIVYPVLPTVLKQFAASYPRIRVHLTSSFTEQLMTEFREGRLDAILTTETGVADGGETLVEAPLVWVGAPGGQAWRDRPLRLAFERRCIFREVVQRRLDDAGVPWTMAVEADSFRAIGAMVLADLAVHTLLETAHMGSYERLPSGGDLPGLPTFRVNLYTRDGERPEAIRDLSALLRTGYGGS